MIGIYKYTNKDNGKIYIGRSVNISVRKWQHLHNYKNNIRNECRKEGDAN